MAEATKKTPARSKLEARREQRRQSLIEAGLELFGTQGYRNCSVKMVCDQAGLTERYFYESFSNREALLVAVFDSLAADLDVRLRAVVEEGDADSETRCRNLVELFYNYIRDDERRGRMLMFEILGVSPKVDRHYHAAVRNLAALTEHPNLELFRKGPRSKEARRVMSIGLVGAMLQIAIQWVLDDFATSLNKVIVNTLELFMAVSAHHEP